MVHTEQSCLSEGNSTDTPKGCYLTQSTLLREETQQCVEELLCTAVTFAYDSGNA
jgi:hypothetical protein